MLSAIMWLSPAETQKLITKEKRSTYLLMER